MQRTILHILCIALLFGSQITIFAKNADTSPVLKKIEYQTKQYAQFIRKQKKSLESIIKSTFMQGTISGFIAQLAVESSRQLLPTQTHLYDSTGLCRDRLTGMSTLTLGAALYYYINRKLDPKGLAGVVTGAISAPLIRRILGIDPHALQKKQQLEVLPRSKRA